MLSGPIAPGFSNRITSGFGQRGPEFHAGIDIVTAPGAPVLAILGGRVMVYVTGRLNRYGNTVVIDSGRPGARFQLYAHLDAIYVADGTDIEPATLIGRVGRTAGTRDDPGAVLAIAHLHLEFLTAWPPAGRKIDRVDPIIELNALGVSAQVGAPIGAPAVAPVPVGQSVPVGATAAAAGGALALLFFLFLLSGLSVKSPRPIRLFT